MAELPSVEAAGTVAQADVAPSADADLHERQPAAEATVEEEEEDLHAKATEILEGLPDVQHMRHQLECARSGRDVDEVPSAWADPEEAEREVAELRRVRRQIRYLFGGMIGNLPESSTLRVDDLLSEQGDDVEAQVSPTNAPMQPVGIMEFDAAEPVQVPAQAAAPPNE